MTTRRRLRVPRVGRSRAARGGTRREGPLHLAGRRRWYPRRSSRARGASGPSASPDLPRCPRRHPGAVGPVVRDHA
ncbi:hypothetical protein FTX61_17210 [Nitriliruptoraceae bacterium ZYF776]|nr:hypothetical protein [Profundirhabdus halotolerans]